MRLNLVAHTLGLILRYFGLLLLFPLVTDLIYGNWWAAVGFAVAGVAASSVGELGRRIYTGNAELSRIEGIAVVALSWMIVAIFGAVPYWWAGLGTIDALFESMSGFTTTGATVFTDFGAFSKGIFLWRSLSQWLGGMGVITLFIAILPALAIAGRQMFFAEAPGPAEERLTPRIRQTAILLWSTYVGLTGVQVLSLFVVGMPLFDALCNSLSTLAAGGFSPHPGSIGGYENPAAEWVFIIFIFLAGANYSLQYRAVRGQPGRLFRDEELRGYVALVLVATMALAFFLWQFAADPGAEYLDSSTSLHPLENASSIDLVRQAMFQVLTIITTAGFATDDFDLWNDQAKVILFILMFVGGCAGSASGGPKVVRILLIAKYAMCELTQALHPRAVRPVRLNRCVVPPQIMRAIVSFLLLYLVVYVLSVAAIVGLGADLVTGLTACIATLGNIGPGFGMVGPMSSYAEFPLASKLVFILTMWIGRLEVMTVLILLHPSVWRSARVHSPSMA